MIMKKTVLGAIGAILSLSLFLAAPAASQEGATARKYISLTDGPSQTPFSTAILAGDTLYISGMLATDPATGKMAGETITAQAERIFQNFEIVLKKAGMDLSNVVSTSVFIMDFKEFAEFNAAFRKWFPKNPPTRATVQVSALALAGAKIEISAVAVR
jgi:2-iminobutanoate/2-iminopropanoate deaminase